MTGRAAFTSAVGYSVTTTRASRHISASLCDALDPNQDRKHHLTTRAENSRRGDSTEVDSPSGLDTGVIKRELLPARRPPGKLPRNDREGRGDRKSPAVHAKTFWLRAGDAHQTHVGFLDRCCAEGGLNFRNKLS
jgi:hypothetical protein